MASCFLCAAVFSLQDGSEAIWWTDLSTRSACIICPFVWYCLTGATATNASVVASCRVYSRLCTCTSSRRTTFHWGKYHLSIPSRTSSMYELGRGQVTWGEWTAELYLKDALCSHLICSLAQQACLFFSLCFLAAQGIWSYWSWWRTVTKSRDTAGPIASHIVFH